MTFQIDADPIPLARPRFSRGRAYLPQRSRNYREVLQAAVKSQLTESFRPFVGDLHCHLKFYRKFNPSSRRFGDIDNHVKAILDATQGLLFNDDSQVVAITAEKFQDKAHPRTEIFFEIKKSSSTLLNVNEPFESTLRSASTHSGSLNSSY